MPELPEVETIRKGLVTKLLGRKVTGIEVSSLKQFTGDPEQLVGLEVIDIYRKGKLLIFLFKQNVLLTVHLKMTGQLIWRNEQDLVMGGHPEASYLDPLPHKHTRIILNFDDGSTLFYNDVRRFGRMVVESLDSLATRSFIQKLGPEPLEPSFKIEYLLERLKLRARTSIKGFLLDQTNIAGLGNIYADESLFRAAILPYRKAGELSKGEVRNLYDAIQETLELALLHNGSTERDYRTAVGEKGTYLSIANVYRRTGQNCNRCQEGEINRTKLAGRSTHYCPICQR